MIIDMFSHIGTRKGVDYSAESMIGSMDANNIDKALVCCMLENIDNKYTYEAFKKYPERFIPCAVINPWSLNAEAELDKCFKDYSFYGVKLSATRFGFSGDREGLLDPIFEKCKKYKKFVIVHAVSDLFSMPDKWAIMGKKYPEVPLLLNHTGISGMCDRTIELVKSIPNLYISTAATYAPALKKAIEELNGYKIVFSSDTPATATVEEIEKIEFCCNHIEIRNRIFFENANNLINGEGY